MQTAPDQPLEAASTTRSSAESCARETAELKAWAIDTALPLWSTQGFDRAGQRFRERLDWAGAPIGAMPHRSMVQARQIYVFAHAAVLGWFPKGGALAETAMESLLRVYRSHSGAAGGFAFSIGADGSVASEVRDAYAHAFILFAIAWLYRLNGAARLLSVADETIAFIDACLEDPVHGGVFDAFPVKDRAKKQNPHMHLLEAYLALDAAAPGRGYIERAGKLVALFAQCMVDRERGVLPEHFAQDWSAHPDPARRFAFEPGHHFEWVWLLREYENRAATDLSRWVEALDESARRVGLSESMLIFDEVGDGMRVAKRSHRLWTHTEGAKAAVARHRAGDPAAPEFARAMIAALRDNFLDRPFAGGWIDHFGWDRRPLVDYVPASSLYHLFLATSELSQAFGGAPSANSRAASRDSP